MSGFSVAKLILTSCVLRLFSAGDVIIVVILKKYSIPEQHSSMWCFINQTLLLLLSRTFRVYIRYLVHHLRDGHTEVICLHFSVSVTKQTMLTMDLI